MSKTLVAEPHVQATCPGLTPGLHGAPRSCTVELTRMDKAET